MQANGKAHGPNDHLQESTWERLALGELEQEAMDVALEHASRCGECGQILRGLQTLEREALEVDSERVPILTRAGRSQGSSPWLYTALGAAAMVVFAVGTSTFVTQTQSDALITERSSAEIRPEALGPVGVLTGAPRAFRWAPAVPNRTHSVELLDSLGAPLWRSDALVANESPWPTTVEARPGHYYWRVWESDEDGNITASIMTSFEIVDGK